MREKTTTFYTKWYRNNLKTELDYEGLCEMELMKLDEKTRAQVVPLLLGIINQVQGQN
ncbi:MAG: hypothetical protein K6G88_00425 [Lachnospiraceae bacterium]|nr:hypothetical protein [Lachnospiraceae bacterium]